MPRNIHDLSPPDGPDKSWEYTNMAIDIARLRQQAERRDGRQERPTIGRDTRIDGGVYEGSYGGEAIVVDREKYPSGYEYAKAEVTRRSIDGTGAIDKNYILDNVFKVVGKMMAYDQGAVNRIFEKEGGKDGTKIALDMYANLGVGVCRHQALFVAQLLEGFVDDGVLHGQVSVDRNMVRMQGDDYDGHAWVRYTTSGGTVYILDVAQNKIALLSDLMAAHDRGENVWDYAREEDEQRAGSRGKQAVGALRRLWESLHG